MIGNTLLAFMVCFFWCFRSEAMPVILPPVEPYALFTSDIIVDIRVSPNPATDYFIVSGTTAFRKIQVYNIIGKEVKTFNATIDNEYDIENLPSGIYILRFLDNGNNLIKAIKLYKR